MKIKFIKPPTDVYDVTVGKEYEVVGGDTDSYLIENDKGYDQSVYHSHVGSVIEIVDESLPTPDTLEDLQEDLTDIIQTFLREIPQEHHPEVSFLQDGSFHIYMMNNQFACATEYRLVEVMQALVTLYGKCDE